MSNFIWTPPRKFALQIVQQLENKLDYSCEFKLRENQKAAASNSPWAAYDVLVRPVGNKRGRCVATYITPLRTVEGRYVGPPLIG